MLALRKPFSLPAPSRASFSPEIDCLDPIPLSRSTLCANCHRISPTSRHRRIVDCWMPTRKHFHVNSLVSRLGQPYHRGKHVGSEKSASRRNRVAHEKRRIARRRGSIKPHRLGHERRRIVRKSSESSRISQTAPPRLEARFANRSASARSGLWPRAAANRESRWLRHFKRKKSRPLRGNVNL